MQWSRNREYTQSWMSGPAGRFSLAEKLGAGAMGEVWKARDEDLGRWVALKFLKGSDAEEVGRFRREAQLAARLNHPNIAAIYEVGEADGRPFIAMQHVAGRTLSNFPLGDLRRAAELVRDAARAVHYAHEQGIVHRDLKPSNLMVEGDRVFVMDFGLARQASVRSSLSATGLMVGTPSYMSPEQARADRVDARSDVWALGATLYEMLCGRVPFDAPDLMGTLTRIVEDEPAPPGAGADLDTIVLKCLEKSPARRYQSAAALADDLDRWLKGDPIAARRASLVYRLRKRLAKRKALVLTSAALVAVAAAALTVQAVRSSRRAAVLQELSTLWATIIERHRELRLGRVDHARATADLRRAVESLDAHIAAWPHEPQGYYVRGRGRLYLSDPVGAEADAARALALRPDFRPAWTLTGMVRMFQFMALQYGPAATRARRRQQDRVVLNQALEALGRGWTQGREREEAARWGLPSTREDQVVERLAHALRLLEKSREEAIRFMRRAVDEYHAEEYAEWLAWAVPPGPEGLHWLDMAIEWAPGWLNSRIQRGWVRLEAGDFAGARADFETVVRMRPDIPAAWDYLAEARHMLGDCAGALRDATRAIELAPGEARAWITRGLAKSRLRDYDGARADYDHAIELRPEMPEPFINRGNVRRWQGDLDGSLADLDRAVELGTKGISG